MDLKALRARINRAKAELDLASTQVEEEEHNLTKVRGDLEDSRKAQTTCQNLAEALQESAHQQVSEVVTRCLRAVFGDDAYEFGISFEQKRGKTEAVPYLKRGNLIITDPLNQAGGGVCDVISFALRIAHLLLSRPQRRKLIVADEPMRGVRGKVYQDRVGELIEALSMETGIQFLISSDFEWLKMGEVINLEK